MERRSVLASLGLGLLSQSPFTRSLRAEPALQRAAGSQPPASAYDAFVKIAKAKGVKIFINQAPPAVAAAKASAANTLHLDMNMVRASIEDAIAKTKQNASLNAQLTRLLRSGTPVQQVEFVMGTGRYYFPWDVEAAIADSGKAAAASIQCTVCENVCHLVCSCLGNGDQYCQDKCRDICHKYDC
jgi:hypothetical protein